MFARVLELPVKWTFLEEQEAQEHFFLGGGKPVAQIWTLGMLLTCLENERGAPLIFTLRVSGL